MQTVTTDLIILGGGIAGLWLLNRARQQGFDAILLESHSLGGGQSVRSQGIIHGGTKYALNGVLSQASNSIANMPSRWRDCLEGHGELDLSQAQVLSDAHYMWSMASLGSKMTTFLASKALKGRVGQVPAEQRPPAFQHPDFRGSLYKLNEIVLDVPSVIEALARPNIHSIYKVAPSEIQLDMQHGEIQAVQLKSMRIEAQRYITTAGEGSEELLQQLEVQQPQMQRRPLHMVMVRHRSDLPTFAHCISSGSKPVVTITTHPTLNGDQVWYLGGDLAETGVERSAEEQIQAAQQLLTKLLPWVILKDACWGSFHINRAEPKQSSLTRPDSAFAQSVGNCIISWPTKLALAPDLADQVLDMLKAQRITPRFTADTTVLGALPKPGVAEPVWESLLC
ncbi:FAD-dependent oxidoreductase [Amphritea japonica]|uniref:FAD-dependent oxidoreductase n=1 Tax=Amphritea japonica ATCC BAA-1530 TaxID=1278309 RepID=A0A7R6P0E0_9GAMM|nr:FAD-dependent oxidoreductase [Amphritea japonica]BBB24813.1 FAD-dependent oxidoreductase [Amphritea japonica ATCC BAA-1530]